MMFARGIGVCRGRRPSRCVLFDRDAHRDQQASFDPAAVGFQQTQQTEQNPRLPTQEEERRLEPVVIFQGPTYPESRSEPSQRQMDMKSRMRDQSRNELGRASPHQHNSQHDLPLSIARDGPQLNTAAPTAAAAETARNVHSTRAPLARSRDCYAMEDAAVGAPRLATVVPGSLTRKGSTRIIGSLGANIAGQIPSRTRVVQGDQGKVQMTEDGSTQEAVSTSHLAPDAAVGNPQHRKQNSKERKRAEYTHMKIQETRAMKEKKKQTSRGQPSTSKAANDFDTGESSTWNAGHGETPHIHNFASPSASLHPWWLPSAYWYDGQNYVSLSAGYYLLPLLPTPPCHPSYPNQPHIPEYSSHSEHPSTRSHFNDASDAAWPMEESPASTEKGSNRSRPDGEVPTIRISNHAASPAPAPPELKSPTAKLVDNFGKESSVALPAADDLNTSPPDAAITTGLNEFAAIGAQHDETNSEGGTETSEIDVTADVNRACNLPPDYDHPEIDSIVAVESSIRSLLQGKHSLPYPQTGLSSRTSESGYSYIDDTYGVEILKRRYTLSELKALREKIDLALGENE